MCSEKAWPNLDPTFTPEDGKFMAELAKFLRETEGVELGISPGCE